MTIGGEIHMNRIILTCILFITVTFSSVASETRYIGHVPRSDGDFQSKLIFSNLGPRIKVVALKGFFYDSAFEDIEVVVEAGEYLEKELGELFVNPDVSHIYITGSKQISVSLRIGAKNNARGADALLHETNMEGDFFRIYPSTDPSDGDYWEGVAITNAQSSRDNAVKISLFASDNAEPLAEQNLDLTYSDKQLVNLLELIPDVDALSTRSYYFQITSTSNIAVTVLRGSTSRLDVSTAAPMVRQLDKPTLTAFPEDSGTFRWARFEENVLSTSYFMPTPCHRAYLNTNGTTVDGTLTLVLGFYSRAEACVDTIALETREWDLKDLLKEDTSRVVLTSVEGTILGDFSNP